MIFQFLNRLYTRSHRFVVKCLYTFILSGISIAYADSTASRSPRGPSLGDAANNMLEPIGAFTSVLYNISYIIGVMLLLGAIIRFKEYRENPSQTRLSTPFAFLIFGGVFIALPFIARLSPASTAATG